MKKAIVKTAFVIAVVVATQATFAGNSVLAGRFEGAEPKSAVVWEFYNHLGLMPTQVVKFTVSASGTYRMEDAFEYWYFNNEGNPGLNLINALYQGGFNPKNMAANRLGVDQYAAWPRRLEAGTEYTLVLQNPQTDKTGTWTLAFHGPGDVISSASVGITGIGQGKFTGNELKSDKLCSESPAIYQVQGPFKVSRDGIYYVTNLSHLSTAGESIYSHQTCFGLYSAPPQIDQPELNRLHYMSYYRERLNLQADEDYYLLVQSINDRPLDYFFLVAPPAPFEITSHMSGLWADPETDGQGLMLNVYPSINAVHMAWFTYDLERPAAGAIAQLGDPGQRWLTAFGELAGGGSDMTITRTKGGVFDAIQPVPDQIQDGSVQLHFDSCTSGTLLYDLGSAHATGQLTLRRPFEDRANIVRCEMANMGPGIPGPL